MKNLEDLTKILNRLKEEELTTHPGTYNWAVIKAIEETLERVKTAPNYQDPIKVLRLVQEEAAEGAWGHKESYPISAHSVEGFCRKFFNLY